MCEVNKFTRLVDVYCRARILLKNICKQFLQNGQIITENGQQLETSDGQIIQHSAVDGSVIRKIQQGGGAIVTIKSTKGNEIYNEQCKQTL